MMTIGSTAHILMLVASIIIGVILFFIVKYSSEKAQNIIIATLVAICMFGIFFLHGTHYFTKFDIANLLTQMFQVCNFNLILLPICLFKRCELARQYLFFFSMPMALSTFVSYPSDISNSMWYSVECLTFWCNHLLIVLVPILMIATKRFKPKKEYVIKVVACVFMYFLVAFLANFMLNNFTFTGPHNHSYTMNAGSIMILEPIYKLIPIPFVYLIPLAVPFGLIFWLEALMFSRYNTKGEFGFCIKK